MSVQAKRVRLKEKEEMEGGEKGLGLGVRQIEG